MNLPLPPGLRPLTIVETLAVLALAAVVAVIARQLALDGVFCVLNDDAVYAMYAKALHDGLGYVDTAPPNPVTAMRYPIGFPAVLAAVLWGAGALEEIIARLQWVGPVTFGLAMAASYWYFRREAGAPWLLAAGATLLLICHNMTFKLGTVLISDFFFAMVSLPVIALLDRQLKQERPRWQLWVLGGALVGLLCLTRYIGVTLLVAVGLLLLLARRFKELVPLALGFGLAFGPWMLFRALSGGEEYHSTLGFLLDKDLGFLWQNVSLTATMLFVNTLPSFVVPSLFGLRTAPAVLASIAISGVMLLGLIAGLRRPLPGQTALGPMYLLVTSALLFVWMIRYVLTGESATVRLLLPLAPFALLAFARGLIEIRDRLGLQPAVARGLLAASLAVAVGFAAHRVGQPIMSPQLYADNAVESARYRKAFAFVREQLPEDARLMSLRAPVVHFHTGRKTVSFSWSQPNRQILETMAREKVDYMAGLPFHLATPEQVDKSRLPADQQNMVDASVVIINDMVKTYPGLLEGVYFAEGGSIGIFKINHEKLAAYAAEEKAK